MAKNEKTPPKSFYPLKVALLRHYPTIENALIALSECESNRTANLIHIDVDGLKVYGMWQFKWKTFESAVKKFGLRQEITLEDILNPALQLQVVKTLLKDNPNNWRLWYNCGKQIGLDKLTQI